LTGTGSAVPRLTPWDAGIFRRQSAGLRLARLFSHLDLGRPRGRKDASSPSRPATLSVQEASPNGAPLDTQFRMAVSSPALNGLSTHASQSRRRGTGPGSSGGRSIPGVAVTALDQGHMRALETAMLGDLTGFRST